MIEEYAISGRICVCFNPPNLPISAFSIIRSVRDLRCQLCRSEDRIARGPIFCQVKTSIIMFQFEFTVICGSQKWNGALPIFISRALTKVTAVMN